VPVPHAWAKLGDRESKGGVLSTYTHVHTHVNTRILDGKLKTALTKLKVWRNAHTRRFLDVFLT